MPGIPTLPPRKPWLAALLNVALPGLGLLYAGRLRLAGAWFLAALGIGLAAAGSILWLPPSPGAVAVFLLLATAAPLAGAALAWRVARRAPVPFTARPFNRPLVYLGAGVLIVLVGNLWLSHVVRPHFIQAFRNPTGSMEPTVQVGDYFLVDRFRPRHAERMRTVVFESIEVPGLHVIERIVAVGGDTIAGRDDAIIVNGRAVPAVGPSALTEESVADTLSLRMLAELRARLAPVDTTAWTLRAWGPLVVPQGTFFALGDHRAVSYDSRYYGPVPSDRIIGWPRVIYYSRLPGAGVQWSRIGMAIR